MSRYLKGQRAASRFTFLAVIAALGGALSACAPWPNYATGGLAERHGTNSGAIVSVEERFRLLWESGAQDVAAARMYEANLLLIRARREHAGGLYPDAAATLQQADYLIASIESDFFGKDGRGTTKPRGG